MEGMDDSGEIFEAKISVRSKLQCGEVSELVTNKIRFLDRLFREKNKKQVKLKELWQIIYNEKLWCALDDEDAVRDSIPNLVLVPTSKELKADLWVHSQYYFSGVDAPFIQSVKPKAIDFQRCESEVVDNVHAEEKVFPRLENVPVDVVQKQDGPLVQQGKAPPCSTDVQADAVKKQDVPLVQETQDVLGYVGSSFKGRFDPKIMDIVELLCKQLIDVRPEMKGMVDQLKKKVIDSLTTIVESVVEHVGVPQAEVVNCKMNFVDCLVVEKDDGVVQAKVVNYEMNLVDCPVVEKDVGVVQGEVVNCEMNLVDCPVVEKDVGVVQGEVVNCEMNLVDCPVVEKDVSDPKKLSCRDTQPSPLDHLINACAYVSPPLPFYDILKADNFGEPSQVNNDFDDYMDIKNDPSKYCLDNMTIGIEEDTRSGELTVSLIMKKIDFMLEDNEIVNENNDFDKLLKDGNINIDKLIADVTNSANQSIWLQMIKASEVNVVKGDGKPILGKVFEAIGRIKKPDKLQPFKEVLRRHCKSNPNKVTIPTCMKSFLRNGVGPKQMYKFPWVNYGIVVDEHFWLALWVWTKIEEGRCWTM
ncbi:hypothetical protein Tco_0957452 [Tanacetum coccineum]